MAAVRDAGQRIDADHALELARGLLEPARLRGKLRLALAAEEPLGPELESSARPCGQLTEAKWLGDVILRARLEGDLDDRLVAARSDDDHGHVGQQLRELAAHLETVDVGETEIEQHEVGRDRRCGSEGLDPRRHEAHIIAPDAVQHIAHHVRQRQRRPRSRARGRPARRSGGGC